MTDPAPSRPRRWGKLRWCAIIVVILPTLGLLLLNLLLATPWVCRPLEKKIQERTDLNASIGRISLWPWRGIAIHHLQLEIPDHADISSNEPLLEVKEILIDPVWSSLPKNDRQFKSITIDTPSASIPAEILVAALASTPPPAGPPIAANTPSEEPPSVSTPPPTQPQPTNPPTQPSEPGPPVTSPPKPPIAKPTAPTPILKPEPVEPTRWIHIKNASLNCHSDKFSQLSLRIHDVNGSIPIGGADNHSSLHIKHASINDSEILSQTTAQLNWSSNKLHIDPIEARLGGLNCLITADMMARRGLPLEITTIIPRQPLKQISLPMKGTGHAENIHGKAHFIGAVFAPHTWHAELIATTDDPTIVVKNESTHFDHGQTLILLRSGQLSCVDARLTSEKASIIGNGTLLSDGRLAANVRMIAHPSITQHVVRQFFAQNIQAPMFTELSTPQRAAFDLEARGKLPHIEYTLGHGGPTIRTNITNPKDP